VPAGTFNPAVSADAAAGSGGMATAGAYSTVTDLARFRGWSTSVPRATATW
jgi:hypothetical protein